MLAITPRAKGFHKEIDSIAPDKSISHRTAMFALLAKAPSVVHNYLLAQDTLHTLEIARKLGLKVEEQGRKGSFIFTPPSKIMEPDCVLDCGNAGTAMRLYTGLLSAQKGYFVLSGDQYLHARPMNRVIKPLQSVGAQIYSRSGGYAPLSVVGTELQGFSFIGEIASAQVKSALILAALFAKDSSVYGEREHTRDHTERMLSGMGAQIAKENKQGLCSITINPLSQKLQPLDIAIPADPSSAFFFAVAAAITPDSSVLLKNVLLNPTRIEAFRVLESMGAIIEYHRTECAYEEVGDIYVQSAPLKAVSVSHNISWLIDELPALAVAFCFASGRSEVSNAKELRVKECDRIHAVVSNLKALGIICEEKEDGFVIEGLGDKLESKKIDSSALLRSFGDHRIAMSFAIMGLRLGAEIDDEECISVSFPNFLEILREMTEVRLLD
ncbi:3-phosphoshikimate 1-carboxyvinyltransferase [Helicobacter canis]|uniref:3-phosphoshikimate 1-carboxyvinyltransferase n=1 Tax=Helicobacter canis NCTC 12740 TaxID=1357399 RepID=V8CEQ1_9HELI|nr:3-phosphoshikimate 1-carboxyvinyltransferase [Helicobacter canis]ETD25898.1 3-phosphoshikimate 1-carboxyvinyltransferase [Helicobacter canis NCTC 12740]